MGNQERQKDKKMGKMWTCPFAFFNFCFFDLFCFFPGKKNKSKKTQIEKQKNNTNANGQVHFLHFFHPF